VTTFVREAGPRRNPGSRDHRVELVLEDLRIRARIADENASDTEIEKIARADLAALGEKKSEQVGQEIERLTVLTRLPKRRDTLRAVEMAGMLRLPQIIELNEQLQLRPGSGRKADRWPAIAMLWALAGGLHERPCISTAHEAMLGDPLLGFALGYPRQRPLSSLYELIGSMCAYHDPWLAMSANIAIAKTLAARHASAGGYPMGKVLMVDGTFVQGHFQQRMARSERERELMYSDAAPNAAFARYTNAKGDTLVKCSGYKWVSLIDPRAMIPLVGRLVPASADERGACTLLLEDLFELWPDHPVEYLVGDSYFDHSKRFNRSLESCWSIHPVFPSHGASKSDSPYADTDGVPHCDCKLPMSRHSHDGFPTLAARQREGLRRGEPMDLEEARVRYDCPNGLHKSVTVRPRENACLYTLLPREATSDNGTFHAMRVAMLLKRNRIESFFASLKHLGLGGKDQQRFRSKAEDTLEWILAIGCLSITARTLLHDSGRYPGAVQILDDLGLLRVATPDAPAIGPTPDRALRGDQMLRDLLAAQGDHDDLARAA